MKIAITILITLVLISVITILLIKKSVKTQDTKINWSALANGDLTVKVTMNLLLPFAVTITDLKINIGAGSTLYFTSSIPELKLTPKLNIIPITFVTLKPLSILDLASIATQKKYITISGTVLGLEFSRIEELN